ncbi:MAG: ABC-type transport auxiliary lipoprotein family protein [Kofleriaceae bacterium]|nr:ABC-type transport auxiliary lipoprotein family protein [Kofleriaceae bacterium]
MMHLDRLVLGGLLVACAAKTPPTRYYALAAPPAPRTDDRGTLVIGIDPFETDSAYDEERIVYRLSPYRFDYYNYHRWSSPPGTMVARYLERALEHSGRFGEVSRDASDAPLTLGGRLIALEEVDRSPTRWVGRIVLELRLTETSSGEVLWSRQYEQLEPMPQQSPEGLAQAISTALDRISADAVPTMARVALAARESAQQARRDH